jgi:hypothetical protein
MFFAARAFYVNFFLTHAEKLSERVSYYSEQHLQVRERAISANELLTWAECHTVATKEHPPPWPTWNFSACFPDMPFAYRRSVIKDAIGKVRAYLYFERRHSEADWEQQSPRLVHGRSQSTRDIAILLAMRREGREVLEPTWQTHQSEMGKAVLVSCLSL